MGLLGQALLHILIERRLTVLVGRRQHRVVLDGARGHHVTDQQGALDVADVVVDILDSLKHVLGSLFHGQFRLEIGSGNSISRALSAGGSSARIIAARTSLGAFSAGIGAAWVRGSLLDVCLHALVGAGVGTLAVWGALGAGGLAALGGDGETVDDVLDALH